MASPDGASPDREPDAREPDAPAAEAADSGAGDASGPTGVCTLEVEADGLTDPGKVRSNNEDQFLIARLETSLRVQATSLPENLIAPYAPPSAALLIVSDGMGGHEGGEVASALAVETVRDAVARVLRYRVEIRKNAPSLVEGFQTAFRKAQAAVKARARRERIREHMGATLTAAYVEAGKLVVAHAGDSRLYLLRDGGCHQLTSDHTLAEALRSAGAITDTQAIRHHGRHILTNALGTSEEIDVETSVTDLEDGDRILLMSDGCHGLVPDERIAELGATGTPTDACRLLVDAALDAGGNDNVTVVCARVFLASPAASARLRAAAANMISPSSDTEPALRAVQAPPPGAEDEAAPETTGPGEA